jgi:uncharacterized phage-associated protein
MGRVPSPDKVVWEVAHLGCYGNQPGTPGCYDAVMANVIDVAAYIVDHQGSLPAMKLQKLVYYAQAWSLVWDDQPLFPETIEAWANGPVVPTLYQKHRGVFLVDRAVVGEGNPEALTEQERETVDAVLGFYGDRSSQWLSDLTHRERPWREARKGLGPGDRGSQVISLAALAEYYGGL